MTVCDGAVDVDCAAVPPDVLVVLVALAALDPDAAFCALFDAVLCAVSPLPQQAAAASSIPIAIQFLTRCVDLQRESVL